MKEYPVPHQAFSVAHEGLSDDDLFSHLPDEDPFEVKKERLAAELAALMSYCRKNRTSIAEGLGWKKSQVSRVLSGRQNLTLKTLWDFCSHLGYDFDVVFRSFQEQEHNRQPWQRNAVFEPDHAPREFASNLHYVVKAQTPTEVIRDCLEGRASSVYISVTTESVVAAGILKTVEIPSLGVPSGTAKWQYMNMIHEKERV